MAGLVPAIHVFAAFTRGKNVDAIGERSDAVLRTAMDKPGHDGSLLMARVSRSGLVWFALGPQGPPFPGKSCQLGNSAPAFWAGVFL